MKTVLLDLFGVACPDEFKKRIMYPMFRDMLEAQVDAAYNSFKFGQIDEDEFWARLGWDTAEGRAEMLKRVQMDPHLREVVAYLKRKNFAVVLFSDFPKVWLDMIARRNSLQPLFDKVVSTPEWGYAKNNANLYAEATRQFGECIMVDDNLAHLAIASHHGIATVWKKGLMEGTSFEPDQVIRYLDELKEVI